MQFTWVPPEIAIHILEYLSTRDLSSFCSVSHHCERIGSLELVWKKHARLRWKGLLETDEAPRGWKNQSLHKERLVSVFSRLILDPVILPAIYESTIRSVSFQERRFFMDGVARTLSAEGTTGDVFSSALVAELEPASPLSVSMLRGSSLSTELFYSFSRIVGGKYIRRRLGSILKDVFNDKMSLQLDPRHLPAGETKEENEARIRQYVARIIQRLSAPKAVTSFPDTLREVFHTLRETTLACGHSVDLAQHLEVSFFFSKFVQPAIVKPELYDGSLSLRPEAAALPADDEEALNDQIQQESRNRQKVCVIAKVLGNVIQGIEFSDIEPEFQSLNDLVTSGQAGNQIRTVLHTILRGKSVEKVFSDARLSKNHLPTRQDWHCAESSFRFLYRCLDTHAPQILVALSKAGDYKGEALSARFSRLLAIAGRLLRAPSMSEALALQAGGQQLRQRNDGTISILIGAPTTGTGGDYDDVLSDEAKPRRVRARSCFGAANAAVQAIPLCSG
eukprot:TRINITY_DN3925_c0_g1_i2.p1 TRINITY_DN3925_c0_g1~~TRINITY_DN3925_c0_g1_i2.p1  ORF type:complete len:506 (-),score=29.05 TRINITY_DN3925_c0_g1_i2:1-1518(-)